MMHATLFMLKTLGMKLGVDDESVNPILTSGPPAARACQLWSAVPVKVPLAKPVSCSEAVERRVQGSGLA